MCCVVALSTACTAVNDADFALRQEFHRNVQLFGVAADQYAGVADQMAGKKHDLQGQLITRTTDQWLKDHTGPDGQLHVDAASMATMLAQRDAAVELKVQSAAVWSKASRDFRTAVADMAALSRTVSAAEVDAKKAKDQMTSAFNHVVELFGAGGLGVLAAGAL